MVEDGGVTSFDGASDESAGDETLTGDADGFAGASGAVAATGAGAGAGASGVGEAAGGAAEEAWVSAGSRSEEG